MRALLRDQSDNTLMVICVTEASFDPKEQELYLYAGESCYTVQRVTSAIADSLLRELFETGKADFTQFGTEVDE